MATNINSNKVRAAIENLKAHNLKLDFNCPRLVSDLTQAMHKILKLGISLEDLKTEKYSMILYYQMLTQANHIYTKEIQENLERFEEILEEKKIQALAEGKKLLVIFGEDHNLQI